MRATDATAAVLPPGGAPQVTDDAAALVRTLAAEPRPAGGAAEARARAECARRLAALGFETREEAFEYSAFPGLWATPLGGIAAGGALMAAGHVGYFGDPQWSLGILLGGAAAAGVAGAWLARRGVLALPLLRRRGVNLVATRGAEPAVWLMAHLDSKSQPVPIGVRAAGITLVLLTAAAAVATAAAQLLGAPGVARWWPAISLTGLIASLPVMLSVVGGRSPGALDNATGVAAALLTAARLPDEPRIGVVLTSAEELGLAGGRAWAAARTPGVALNFDTIDDGGGAVTAMYTRRAPRALLDALEVGAAAVGARLAARRLLPGILTDGVALADRGWTVATLSRGTLATLGRVHRRADRADRVSGAGVRQVAALAAAAVPELLRQRRS